MTSRSVILSILIVNWNTRDLLAACLESLYHYSPTCDFQVLVVDNASADGSSQMVRERFPQVLLIENGENVGFARANNQGARECLGRYILLLNPDTEVFPGALDALVSTLMANRGLGGVGARLLNPDGSLQISCFPLPTLAKELWRLFHLDTIYPYACYPQSKWDKGQQEVASAQGACLLLRREALEQVGFFDDSYYIYSEEVDLCRRLRQHGWKIQWTASANVVHHGGQSTHQIAGKMFLQLYKAKVQYFRKNHGCFAAQIYKLVLVAASVTRIVGIPIVMMKRPDSHRDQMEVFHRYKGLLIRLSHM